MVSLDVPEDVFERYDRLVSRLEGFNDAETLALFVLQETATELEHASGDSTVRDDGVERRLQDLGYIE